MPTVKDPVQAAGSQTSGSCLWSVAESRDRVLGPGHLTTERVAQPLVQEAEALAEDQLGQEGHLPIVPCPSAPLDFQGPRSPWAIRVFQEGHDGESTRGPCPPCPCNNVTLQAASWSGTTQAAPRKPFAADRALTPPEG
jgi:hypothetical protein